MSGPRVRTDLVEVFVFVRAEAGDGCRFLLLRRAREPVRGTWHPVMGHAREGETAVQGALRELEEETGLAREDRALLGFWGLQGVHPYFMPGSDAVVLSPMFAAEVAAGWEPRLSAEHDGVRWVGSGEAGAFVWPGQRAGALEVEGVIVAGGECSERVRIEARAVARV